MKSDKLYLFRDKRFLPNFIVQFCGCLNDNILKNALIILITYGLSNHLSEYSNILVLVANTIFVLPFIIFASIAGQVADKYERSYLVKIIKSCEIAIIGLAIYGFLHNSLLLLLLSICFMGIHSTFFGPIKYSVLPDHLNKDELLGANGFVEAGTFISIFIGTIIGSYYTINSNFIILALVIVAILGLVTSFFAPKSNNANPDIKINFNIINESLNMLKYAKAKKQVYLAILGISWFWFIGAAIIAQIPLLAKETFGADANVANLFLAIFSLGVGVGSFWCSKIFENEITTKYVFISALGISIFGIDLFFASRISAIRYEPEQLKNILIFLSKIHNWRIVIDLFFIAAIGGLYIVPLFAVLQYFTSPAHRSRIIAVNNLINSIFMAASTIILSLLFYLNFSIPSVILVVSLLNISVAFYIYRLMPEVKIIPFKLIRCIFQVFFDFMYKVEVKGLENFHNAGKRAVIIANHVSYLDPPLLATYLPEQLTFAINTEIAKIWWIKPFLRMAKTLPVDPSNAMALKTLIKIVQKNKKIAIFPEGRISITGSLMKVYEGPGMIADKADAVILPVRIDGTQFTHFSKLKNILKRKIFPKITITILPPVKFAAHDIIDNRERRKYIGQALYDIMADMMFESSDYKNTLFQSLIDSAKLHGFNKKITDDIENNSVTYRQLIFKSFVLADLIKKNTDLNEHVGIMLPNMSTTLITFYATQFCSRIPTMINWTSAASTIISACNTASVTTIYSSRKFIEKAALQEIITKLLEANIKIIYLEDVKDDIGLWLKIKSCVGTFFPQSYYNHFCKNSNYKDKAVILFTSGTEGTPKAVLLSHQNLQANRYQIAAKIHFSPEDLAFIALPMFHCFGLTGTIIMTLNGIKSFFYPSPLHYRAIPEIVYDVGATILIGTDTFLNGYAKYAHPYDFYSIRYVFAGSEKLREKTRQLWLDKYGIRIFEGYGLTEASPIIACNTPMHDRQGTVGRLLSKIEYIIKPVEGIKEGGRLLVKGPNIMLGYIKPDHLEKIEDHWYDTGDIVKIDSEGYITIIGRVKRFAKIAGEMISLVAIEELAAQIDSDTNSVNAAIYLSDKKKGEQILLFTTSSVITNESFISIINKAMVSSIHLPKFIINVKEIPIFPTGKVNYPEVIKMAQEYVGINV
ncbi:acyl-[ACP]--phospholipid O-acyltransferase [Rickettsia endosymbiont of Halotydeus destructor]|uniref:acyl-[ACP]--phospholipid O-acyltransferase n=1 Tax=Rickettsia endosymbiont of Halotydeus destructor TaxID=2996754 RepID=UPI003BAF5296